MSLVAEFTTPASTFAVGRALPADRDMTVELERIVPTDETMIPFLWVWGDGIDEFQSRLREEPEVDFEGPIASTERGGLYRIEWGNAMSAVIRGLFDLEFTLLAGEGDADRWRFEFRFRSVEAASKFQRYLASNGVPHELTRVRGLTELAPRAGGELTEKQRETLIAAYDGGYFEEPRAMTTEELADQLGISTSSASGRLRRATDRLVASTLIADRALRQAGDR